MSAKARKAPAGGGQPDAAAAGQVAEAPARENTRRAAQIGAEDQETTGPFDAPWLNDALSAAFGEDLGNIEVATGQDAENEAIGAAAHTRDQSISLSSEVQPGAEDPRSLEIIAEETAHALAGGGSGQTGLDQAGDPGETRAKESGRRFSSWVRNGMRGEAPALTPATGGRAEIHRHANVASWSGTPMLRQGDRGTNVSTLQTLLNSHGAGLRVDGDFGPKTRAAVVNFQAANGLAVDGVAGPQTAGALRGAGNQAQPAAPAPAQAAPTAALSGSPPLRLGSKGSQVSVLQGLLNQTGAGLRVDGDFGPRTDAAVRAYQRANGLVVDGVVGPQTAGRLNAGNSVTPAPAEPAAPAPAPAAGGDRLTGNPSLRTGAKGPLVNTLQTLLNGFDANLRVDGDFGSKTDAAVRGFQRANSLTVDGVVGPQTAGKLYDPNAKKIVAVANTPSPGGAGQVDVGDADPRNKLNDSRVNPSMRSVARNTIERLQGEGYEPFVVQTYRSFAEQDDAKERGASQVGAGGSWHNYGLAVDIAFWNDAHTTVTWDRPSAWWQRLGDVGKEEGFTAWGGDFRGFYDGNHLEYHPRWSGSASRLLPYYNQGGLEAVWAQAV
jgi:peptidoglycan hydrolase-like protein with peptidoglycan-binding domain